MTGTNHQTVVQGRAPRHRGVLVGRVARLVDDRVFVRPEPAIAAAPLKPGDGLVFDAAAWRSPEEPEEGGRVYQVAPAPERTARTRLQERRAPVSAASAPATSSGAPTTPTWTRSHAPTPRRRRPSTASRSPSA